MIAADSVAAVARYCSVRERRRLRELSLVPIDSPDDAVLGAEEERLDDALRPDSVGPAVRAAESAPEGRSGERARQGARALIRPYLDRACAEQDAAIDERYRRESSGETDFEAKLALENDPAIRDRGYRDWRAIERSLESVRTARQDARNDAARGVGLSSAFALASCAEPRDPLALADEVERGAIRSLDDAVGRASRSIAAPTLTGSAQWRWRRLVDFAPSLSRASIAPILRQLGTALGEDTDTHGPRLLRGRTTWDMAVIPPGERAAVVGGVADGPGGLRSALRAFGGAVRGGAIGRRRGPSAALTTDAAFDCGATILFARLLRSASFRSWAGVRETPGLAEAIALIEASELRSAWSGLRTAARGFHSGDDGETPADERESFGTRSYETDGAAELRGAIFAVLLEESLMTRHGRTWFVDRDAGRRLAEMWEAEPDETAESMASALSLGKMSADVLLEGFRP